MATEISLTRGKVALVDDDDASLVLAHKWHAACCNGKWYARRTLWLPTQRSASLFLHRFVTGYERTDHINGDGLDNRRTNLRPASQSQNVRNRPKTHGRSAFKGVGWHRARGMWRAYISISGRAKHLGHFGSELDAALAYDAAAREYHGEFAALNFARPGERSALSGEIAETLQRLAKPKAGAS